jgi:hypothetical protein
MNATANAGRTPSTTDADASPKNWSVPPVVNEVTRTIMVFVSMPVSTIANRNSFQVAMNANSATTAIPGAMIGTTTAIRARRREHPSIIAASSISTGKSRRNPTRSHTANGM